MLPLHSSAIFPMHCNDRNITVLLVLLLGKCDYRQDEQRGKDELPVLVEGVASATLGGYAVVRAAPSPIRRRALLLLTAVSSVLLRLRSCHRPIQSVANGAT